MWLERSKQLPLRWGFVLATIPCSAMIAQRTTVSRDSAGIRIVESTTARWTATSHPLVDSKPALTLGLGTGGSNDQFGMVTGAVRLSDGSVVVADEKALELRLFGPDGKFRRTIGRKGEGPGDFRAVETLFGAPGDSIIAWDSYSFRLTYFTRDGIVLRTVAVEQPPVETGPNGRRGSVVPKVTGRFANGAMLTRAGLRIRYNPPTSIFIDSMQLAQVVGNGSSHPLGIAYSSTSWHYNFPTGMSTGDKAPFAPVGAVAAGATSYFVSAGSAYEIREYGLTGRLSRIFRIRRAPAAVSPKDIADYKVQRLKDEPPKYQKENETINDWLVFPSSMPVFDAVRVDPSGRVWARVHAEAGHTAPWEVFAPSGEYLGPVFLPAGLEVTEIGRDYILGISKDADDVESVVLYRMKG